MQTFKNPFEVGNKVLKKNMAYNLKEQIHIYQ